MAVVGTIFSVNSGAKGSRVSVIEGEVRVRHSGAVRADLRVLRPGDQIATGRLLGAPMAQEFAWSRNAAAYRELVYGEAVREDAVSPLANLAASREPPFEVAQNCGRCHGVNGHGRGNAAFPKLAGQKPEYLFRAMRAYARSERNSGIMEPLAAGLAEAQWQELAEYYAALPGAPRAAGAEPEASAADIARGRDIALHGIPGKDVPSCNDCHRSSATVSVVQVCRGQAADGRPTCNGSGSP